MKTIQEIRRENLNFLIEQYGSLANLNSVLGRSRTDGTLSQIRNAAINKSSGKRRAMGNAVAREIEKILNLGYGWMDIEHDNTSAIEDINNDVFDLHQDFLIPSIDSSESPKGVFINSLDRGIKLKEYFIRKNFGNVRKEDLRVMTVENSDMRTVAPLDSVVILDKSVRSFTRNGVYLLEINGIKTLRKIVYNFEGGYEIQCDIDRPRTVGDLDGIKILGLAIYIWRGDFM